MDNNEQILDREESKHVESPVFRFQIIEFILLGVFLLMGNTLDVNLVIVTNIIYIFLILILLYSGVRIYYEYREGLITGFGVFLKMILLTNAATILMGALFHFFNWEFRQEMTLIALMSLSYPFVLYALTLSQISMRIKAALIFNSLSLSLLALGIAFRIENWNYGYEMLIGGVLSSFISMVLLLLLMRKSCTPKEKYHSVNYLVRTIGLFLYGSLFLYHYALVVL